MIRSPRRTPPPLPTAPLAPQRRLLERGGLQRKNAARRREQKKKALTEHSSLKQLSYLQKESVRARTRQLYLEAWTAMMDFSATLGLSHETEEQMDALLVAYFDHLCFEGHSAGVGRVEGRGAASERKERNTGGPRGVGERRRRRRCPSLWQGRRI